MTEMIYGHCLIRDNSKMSIGQRSEEVQILLL